MSVILAALALASTMPKVTSAPVTAPLVRPAATKRIEGFRSARFRTTRRPGPEELAVGAAPRVQRRQRAGVRKPADQEEERHHLEHPGQQLDTDQDRQHPLSCSARQNDLLRVSTGSR